MANATVGIAMGAAGSDIALETAGAALIADDLNHLSFAVGNKGCASVSTRRPMPSPSDVRHAAIPAGRPAGAAP